ncbi:hypothetical protein OYC64_002940, partial [Pagothenia borchgrevinki]
KDSEGSGV